MFYLVFTNNGRYTEWAQSDKELFKYLKEEKIQHNKVVKLY